jgi:hypothetical protein
LRNPTARFAVLPAKKNAACAAYVQEKKKNLGVPLRLPRIRRPPAPLLTIKKMRLTIMKKEGLILQFTGFYLNLASWEARYFTDILAL